MKKSGYILFAMLLLHSCKKSAPAPDLTPGTPVLTFPLKDEPCLTATIISETQSLVKFSWSAAANAEQYEVTIKNLLTGSSNKHNSSQTVLEIELLRNTPYSWSVAAKSSRSPAVSVSETWRFYNSGPGILSYAPFPADALWPSAGATVQAADGLITLTWNGADADNDIKTYDLYFGTSSSPPLFRSDLTENTLSGIPVNSGTGYFWKIVTKDARGNRSESEIFSFRVN